MLRAESWIRVLQAGGAMSADMERRAQREQRKNPRYRWLGNLPRGRALDLLRRSRLLVVSSLMEGGANVIGEAVVLGVPVLASRIPGNVGLLGGGYPGYFRPKDTQGLGRLMARAENDPAFLRRLERACAERSKLFRPAAERAAWRALISELR